MRRFSLKASFLAARKIGLSFTTVHGLAEYYYDLFHRFPDNFEEIKSGTVIAIAAAAAPTAGVAESSSTLIASSHPFNEVE